MSMNWLDHIDSYRLITQKLGDQGDTAQRMGMAQMGYWLKVKRLKLKDEIPISKIASPKETLELLECKDKLGRYKRHVDPSTKWSRCDILTRDQGTGIAATMLAGSLTSSNDKEKSFFKQKIKRYFWEIFKPKKELLESSAWWSPLIPFFRMFNFTGWRNAGDPTYTNKSKADISGFMIPSILLRGLSPLWYPVFTVLDGEVFLAAVGEKLFGKPEKDDVLNFVLRAVIARQVYPTIFGWLASKLIDTAEMERKLTAYFTRTFSNGDHGPPMHLLYSKDFLDKALGK